MTTAPSAPDGPVLLYDGVCTFCDASVRFVLDHDRTGRVRFAALQSEAGQGLLRRAGLPADHLSSLVLVEGTEAWAGADAALRLAPHLERPWSWLAGLRVVPRGLRDRLYALFARHRYRLFGKREACRLPAPEERARFLG